MAQSIDGERHGADRRGGRRRALRGDSASRCVGERDRGRAPIFVFSRVGFTRLVSRMTNSRAAGSIQIDVPVKPVWPKARAHIAMRPAELLPVGVSQPERALREARSCTRRELRDRRACSSTRAPSSCPPFRYIRAKRARSCAGAEEARVAGDAAERERVLVVHLAAQVPLPPRVDLRRCNARRAAPRAGGTSCRVMPSGANTCRAGTRRAAAR